MKEVDRLSPKPVKLPRSPKTDAINKPQRVKTNIVILYVSEKQQRYKRLESHNIFSTPHF